jgi:prepilin-type N-terminal cleavage/methylation domain-containing protein
MRRGFSLIELLTVTTIMAVLATLTLPVVGMVRRAVTATACAGNLHQAGLAFLTYANDWDGEYPADSRLHGGVTAEASDAWYDRLPGYLEDERKHRGVLQCAGHRLPPLPAGFEQAAPKSFKVNDRLDGGGRPRYFRCGSVADASDLLLMVDAVAEGVTGMCQWSRAVPSGVTDHRHRGRLNGLAVDGATLLQRRSGNEELTWESAGWR